MIDFVKVLILLVSINKKNIKRKNTSFIDEFLFEKD